MSKYQYKDQKTGMYILTKKETYTGKEKHILSFVFWELGVRQLFFNL